MTKSRKVRNKRKAGSLSKKTAATKIQSSNRGKMARQGVKRLELYNKLPDDLQNLIKNKYETMIINLKKNNKKLLEGAKKGNLKNVEEALDNYAEIETKNHFGWTALHLASYYNKNNIIEFLIKKGANIEAKTDIDETPLHAVSQEGNFDMVKLFLANGSNKEVKNKHGITPLMYSSIYGYIDIVRVLIRGGAKVDIKDNDGMTALDHAKKSLDEYGSDMDDFDTQEEYYEYGMLANEDGTLANEDGVEIDNLPIIIKLLEKTEQKQLKQSTSIYRERRRKVKDTRKRREGKGVKRKSIKIKK